MAALIKATWADAVVSRGHCGKQRFSCLSAAASDMADTARRAGRRGGGVRPMPYYCEHCSAYHWGHIPIGAKMGRRAPPGSPSRPEPSP